MRKDEFPLIEAYADSRVNDVLDKIRTDIEIYEADCRLQDDKRECEKCNDSVFGSIYRIIDKYKTESEMYEYANSN